MTRVTPEQASESSVAISHASRRTRVAWRTRSPGRADCDSIVCTTRCYRRTCISVAKVTFGAVTADRWAVAVSSMARHVARHARHYPTARADSDEARRDAYSAREAGGRGAGPSLSFCRAFGFINSDIPGISRADTQNLPKLHGLNNKLRQSQWMITNFINPLGDLIEILINSPEMR